MPGHRDAIVRARAPFAFALGIPFIVLSCQSGTDWSAFAASAGPLAAHEVPAAFILGAVILPCTGWANRVLRGKVGTPGCR
ncbi:hypothetical protein RN629_07760 [Sphingomonadaceae bacterium jetA1]|jgi:hypothetical protein|uniref:hypothetical protein n=1 Tax=Facivitalis istanbulensis TaxID=3075838 RepID=UPI0034798632